MVGSYRWQDDLGELGVSILEKSYMGKHANVDVSLDKKQFLQVRAKSSSRSCIQNVLRNSVV